LLAPADLYSPASSRRETEQTFFSHKSAGSLISFG
jgi:hypothetical protein